MSKARKTTEREAIALTKYLIKMFRKKEGNAEKEVEKKCPRTKNSVIEVVHKNKNNCINKYAMDFHCGKPYCSVCGEIGSIPHKRRMSRILPRLAETSFFEEDVHLVHYTFSVPEQFRKLFRVSWNYFKEFKRFVKELVEEIYGKDVKGYGFYHMGGDKEENFGILIPHIHVMIPLRKKQEYWHSKETLDNIREIIKNYWHTSNYFRYQVKDVENTISEVDFYYNYKKTLKSKFHLFRYLSRATFRWRDEQIEKIIFRKPLYFQIGKYEGTFNMNDVISKFKEDNADCVDEEQEEMIKTIYGEKICPACGGELEFKKPISLHSYYKKHHSYARGYELLEGFYLAEISDNYKDYYLENKDNKKYVCKSKNRGV